MESIQPAMKRDFAALFWHWPKSTSEVCQLRHGNHCGYAKAIYVSGAKWRSNRERGIQAESVETPGAIADAVPPFSQAQPGLAAMVALLAQ
jgi:hypothetical protein